MVVIHLATTHLYMESENKGYYKIIRACLILFISSCFSIILIIANCPLLIVYMYDIQIL